MPVQWLVVWLEAPELAPADYWVVLLLLTDTHIHTGKKGTKCQSYFLRIFPYWKKLNGVISFLPPPLIWTVFSLLEGSLRAPTPCLLVK